MKKKTALIFGLLLLILLSLTTKLVLSQSTRELPRIMVACENRNGSLSGFDDGFSILKKCSKGMRLVKLGETGGSVIGNGEIAFVSNYYILKKNGEVWNYSPGEGGLFEWSYFGKLPDDVKVEKILQWDVSSFLTADGIFYFYNNEGSYLPTSEVPTLAPNP